MSQDAHPVRGQPEEMVCYLIRLLGGGAATDPTVEVGTGITATNVATGHYRVTFAEDPGNYLSAFGQWAQNAPAAGGGNLVNIDHDSYTSTSKALDVFIEDPGSDTVAPALADMATTDRLYLQVWFKRSEL